MNAAASAVVTRRPFYFLRHGQTDWNLRHLCVGQADVPLNAKGLLQAEATISSIRHLDLSHIFHSPLIRAHHTAVIIGKGLGLDLIAETDLREVGLGEKEGRPENDPADDFVTAWIAGAEIEGAETFTLFQTRTIAAVNRCLAHAGDTISLVIAHSGVFMALSSACGAKPKEIEHCKPYLFEPTNMGWIIKDVRRPAIGGG